MDSVVPSPSKNLEALINEIYTNLSNPSKFFENISFFPLVFNFVSKFSFVPIGYLCLSKLFFHLDFFAEAENLSSKGLQIIKDTNTHSENLLLENDFRELTIKCKLMLKKSEEAQQEMAALKKEGFFQLYTQLETFKKEIKNKYDYMVN